MAVATYNGIDIPYVHSQVVSTKVIGDRSRTARGKMRQDAIVTKKTFELETRPMKKSDADLLVDELESTKFASGTFIIEGVSYDVYITDIEVERTQFEARDGSGWQADGRTMTLTIEEV